MKAFRMKDGRINVFRVGKHHERLVRSLTRMCMPVIPIEIFEEGIVQLVKLDSEWISAEPGSALYIRPFMYASEAKFGVHVSQEYRFVIFTGPVGSLYSKSLKVKVESEYIRAAEGGTGYAKCGGNYGGALYPTQLAQKQGYDQVLWTDARYHTFIEESGTMNVMFVIDGILLTPPLSDSILDGVTRDSLLTIANELGINYQEIPISVEQLKKGFNTNSLSEAFGAGTAAVIAPISIINIEGMDYPVRPAPGISVAARLQEYLHGIRTGIHEDAYGWNTII
jgi:branched-chain amino acid aminotransferase